MTKIATMTTKKKNNDDDDDDGEESQDGGWWRYLANDDDDARAVVCVDALIKMDTKVFCMHRERGAGERARISAGDLGGIGCFSMEIAGQKVNIYIYI